MLKNGWTWLIVGFLIPLAVTIVNNLVLLNIHELAYYYTPRGMMLTVIVMTVEFPGVIWAVCHCLKKFSSKQFPKSE